MGEHDGALMYWGRCSALAECDMPVKVDWMLKPDYMAIITISNCSILFPMGKPEGAQDYTNLMPRLQAAETVVSGNILRHVRQNAAWHIAVCREHLLRGTHTLII
jgi:hypothetical protein